MPTFEDLLKPRVSCRTCEYIEALPAALQEEVDAAMMKAKYGDRTIERGFAQLDSDAYGKAPSSETIKRHREQGHRAK